MKIVDFYSLEHCEYCNFSFHSGDGTPLISCQLAYEQKLDLPSTFVGMEPCSKEDWARCPLNKH